MLGKPSFESIIASKSSFSSNGLSNRLNKFLEKGISVIEITSTSQSGPSLKSNCCKNLLFGGRRAVLPVVVDELLGCKKFTGNLNEFELPGVGCVEVAANIDELELEVLGCEVVTAIVDELPASVVPPMF